MTRFKFKGDRIVAMKVEDVEFKLGDFIVTLFPTLVMEKFNVKGSIRLGVICGFDVKEFSFAQIVVIIRMRNKNCEPNTYLLKTWVWPKGYDVALKGKERLERFSKKTTGNAKSKFIEQYLVLKDTFEND